MRSLPLLLLALPTLAQAVPTIEASWQACAPIVKNRVPPPGQTISKLVFSTTGVGGIQAFELRVGLGTKPGCNVYDVPDAWRFDANGCEGQALMSFVLDSRDAACPQLGTGGNSILKCTSDPITARMTLLVAYAFATVQADPNVHYHLVTFVFDHTYAVAGAGSPPQTCGGFEKPVCFSFAHQNDAHGDCDPHDVPVYLDANGIQHSFQVDPDVIATFRMDESVPLGCAAATPATPVTWGQIRAQYR